MKNMAKKETRFMIDEQPEVVLKWSGRRKVFSILLSSFWVVFILWQSEGVIWTRWMTLYFIVVLLLWQCAIQGILIFRATLSNGVLTVKRFFRKTISIPVEQIRFGDIHDGFTLKNSEGKTILKVKAYYSGYEEFARIFKGDEET